MPAAGWRACSRRAFLVGSVGGPVLGSLTAGLGLAAPFAIYGVALLVAAGVVFVSLEAFVGGGACRRRRRAARRYGCVAQQGVSLGAVLQLRDGWSVFGLRIALVPLFITEVLHRGTARRGSGAGDVRGRQCGGGHPERLPVGSHWAAHIADRRSGGVGGSDGGCRTGVVADTVSGRSACGGCGRGHVHSHRSRLRSRTSSAAKLARWNRRRDLSDDG